MRVEAPHTARTPTSCWHPTVGSHVRAGPRVTCGAPGKASALDKHNTKQPPFATPLAEGGSHICKGRWHCTPLTSMMMPHIPMTKQQPENFGPQKCVGEMAIAAGWEGEMAASLFLCHQPTATALPAS